MSQPLLLRVSTHVQSYLVQKYCAGPKCGEQEVMSSSWNICSSNSECKTRIDSSPLLFRAHVTANVRIMYVCVCVMGGEESFNPFAYILLSTVQWYRWSM